MPSASPAQARLMQGVAHGWHPTQFKGPSKAVAEDFVAADEAKKQRTRNEIAREMKR